MIGELWCDEDDRVRHYQLRDEKRRSASYTWALYVWMRTSRVQRSDASCGAG